MMYVHIVGSMVPYGTIVIQLWIFELAGNGRTRLSLFSLWLKKLGRKVLSALGSPYAVGTYLLSEWLVTKKVWQLAAYLT